MGTPGARSHSSSRRFPSRMWPSRTLPVKVRKLGAGQGSSWEGKEGAREEGQALNAGPLRACSAPQALWLELFRAQQGGC